MTNSSKASPPATTSSGKSNANADDDHSSISSQHLRKRDKLRKFFRSSKAEETVNTQASLQNNILATCAEDGVPLDNVDSPLTSEKTQLRRTARSDIFSENVNRPAASIKVPEKLGARIHSTPQLALCNRLLKIQAVASDDDDNEVHNGASDQRTQGVGASQDRPTDPAHLDWIKAIETDPVEQHHIHWLGTSMVEEFSKNPVKDLVAISEVVLLGPVLDSEHYRQLLNCFISEFEKAKLLDVHLLQGLIQLVQCASEGYLDADDLIKILSLLREQLQNTHQQSPDHPYQLTLAVSRLLDVMADHNVQDVNRVQEHEPLSKVLSSLGNNSDPYLMYQASYAYQALQYVPDDETAMQAILRHSIGVANSLVQISGMFKMDLSSVLDGLKGFQEVLSSTYVAAKSGYEGFCSLMDSGRGVFDSLKDGLGKGQKRLWYPSLRAAEGFLRQGQLADLNQLIVEAPCRQDPLFQWGICQLLGEMAVDETWETTARQQAIDLLVDLYRNDTEWAQDESVQSWMVSAFKQIGKTSDPAIRDHDHPLLNALNKNGGSATATATTRSYPLKARLPMPRTSPLLDRVQKIPYVEYDLHQLKRQRLQIHKRAVYIPPMAKSSLQASDDDVFPLMEKVSEFLTSERQVMLILGDSGAGKSTFNRHLECEIWSHYQCGGLIPLFINMPALSKPESELIAEQLKTHGFLDDQIQELRLHRQLVVICDGYDESQLTINIHTSNQLNRSEQWDVKLVVSCRSQYFGREYRELFAPQESDHYSAPALHLFQEAVITPFSRPQIEDYVEQYVPLEPRPWETKDYMEKLTTIPNLMDLVTNPFLLILSLGALPSVVKDKKDLTTVRITRIALYDSFVQHWIGANKRRLQKQKLEQSSRAVLAELVDDDFELNGIDYQKRLAAAIFLKQEGRPVVDYSQKRDKLTWKVEFFGLEVESTLLRSCSLLNRVGNQYRFIHRSILEYFYSRHIHEPQRNVDSLDDTAASAAVVQPIADHPLSQKTLVGEPSIIQFLCERVQEGVEYKEQLLAIIERSKTDPAASQAASNAITILVRAGVMFNGADLQRIRIPGADLSGGLFDSAQLQGADLTKANLRNIWLRQADLSNAKIEGVQFGEWPFLKELHEVGACAYSPDGKVFAVGLEDGTISLYKTATWERTRTLRRHAKRVTSVAFLSSGQQIASGSDDRTARLWDVQTGALIVILSGHTHLVASVTFSPSDQQLASGSWDKTVRLWDVQTGVPDAILRGHSSAVTSVVFSPNGQLIASGSDDHTVRLWNAQTGVPSAILEGHVSYVTSVAFSPCGLQIASGSDDRTVRLWDAQAGTPGLILYGHNFAVTRVVFSPSGQQIASSGRHERTVRLWNAHTGAPGAILSGHTEGVTGVVFSPSGQQIASGSEDKTVRLWETQVGVPGAAILDGHTSSVTSVAFSPNGQQLASGGFDDTVRLWDVELGTPGVTLKGHTSRVTKVVFSPCGQQIASCSSDKTVRLWDANTGTPGPILTGHNSAVTTVMFSPCGEQIATGSDDSTVRLWDAHTGAPGAILTDHMAYVTSVAFSPSGQQIASGSWDNQVRLWNAQTGELYLVLNTHASYVTSVVFSPSGQQIASGSNDTTVRLWDAQTGALDATLYGHTHYVMSVVFSPSGEQVASGSVDKTVRLWDVESRQCLTVVRDFNGIVRSVAWTSNGDGSYLATGCGDRSVRVWQVIGDQCLVQLRWSSINDLLTVSDTNILDAQGLSKTNTQFLEQRGAVSKPSFLKEP